MTIATAIFANGFRLSGTGTSGLDGAAGPEIDQRVEIVVERVNGGDVEDLMDEDVRLELSHEEQRHRPRVAAADRSGVHGAAEIVGEDAQPASRRRFGAAGVERHDDGGLSRAEVHLHGDGGADHVLHEWHDLLGEAAQDDPRIGRRVDGRQLFDAWRDGDLASAGGGGEELLLRFEMPQERGRRDADVLRHVGERGAGEPAGDKGPSSGIEDLIAADSRWTAHL
ncbi:MAG TPA: hypothetical protein VHL59_08030 [Thermoanaerobaculia bacterium]|nr:hypothetical protein [Thermoanaerobaculia bacterium]